MSDYPLHLQQIPEFRSLEIAIERQCKKIDDRIQEMRDNLLITTAKESGIARREKILKITPLDTDTLEERRYRVLLHWYDTFPYSEADLRARMDRICGPDQYELTIDKTKNKVSCLLELTSRKMFADVKKLLDDILSLNVILEIGLRYNQWKTVAGKTWQEVSDRTWESLRDEVIG